MSASLLIRRVTTTFAVLFSRTGKGFKYIVIVPCLFVITYLYFFSANQYVSYTNFTVTNNSAQSQAPSVTEALVSVTGRGSNNYPANVKAFLTSREALIKLKEKIPFQAMMEKTGIDFIYSLPSSFFLPLRFEKLYSRFLDMVKVDLDPIDYILELKVNAYNPEDAKTISETLLVLAEDFVNGMSQRANNDKIKFAKDKLAEAVTDARAASLAYANYLKKTAKFDGAEHEKLFVEKELTVKMLEARHALLIRASDELATKSIYVTRISGPTFPESSEEPNRVQVFLLFFVSLFLCWGLLTMTLAGVREHHD